MRHENTLMFFIDRLSTLEQRNKLKGARAKRQQRDCTIAGRVRAHVVPGWVDFVPNTKQPLRLDPSRLQRVGGHLAGRISGLGAGRSEVGRHEASFS